MFRAKNWISEGLERDVMNRNYTLHSCLGIEVQMRPNTSGIFKMKIFCRCKEILSFFFFVFWVNLVCSAGWSYSLSLPQLSKDWVYIFILFQKLIKFLCDLDATIFPLAPGLNTWPPGWRHSLEMFIDTGVSLENGHRDIPWSYAA